MLVRMTPKQRQIAFLSLAGAAALVLIVALIAIIVAVDTPAVWLGTCLALLLVIIVAEIVLLLTEKKDAPDARTRADPDADVEFEL